MSRIKKAVNLIEKTIREIDKGNGITETAVEAFEKIIKDINNYLLTKILYSEL